MNGTVFWSSSSKLSIIYILSWNRKVCLSDRWDLFHLGQSFSTLALLTSQTGLFFDVGGIAGFLTASLNLTHKMQLELSHILVTIKNVSRHCQTSYKVEYHPQCRPTDLDIFNSKCINVYIISFSHRANRTTWTIYRNLWGACVLLPCFPKLVQVIYDAMNLFFLKLALKYTIVAADYSTWWSLEHI